MSATLLPGGSQAVLAYLVQVEHRHPLETPWAG